MNVTTAVREPVHALPSTTRTGLAGEAVALIYIALIATIAWATGAFYVMFPELGALAHDVFTRPRGKWAESPAMLAITPVLTGAVGVFVTRWLPYGYASVMLIVCASILIIELLKSPVAPAISAGLLPRVIDVTSWWYAPGIMLGTFGLAALSILWKKLMQPPLPALPQNRLDDILEEAPHGYLWIAPLLTFVVVATLMVELTGWRFILFPPLVVIGFEMFGHTDVCPWAQRPLWLPVACFLTAFGGFLIHRWFGFSLVTAALSMAWGIAVLRTFDLHVPPALAVALLPMVMDHPTVIYPFSVGIGTLTCTLWFLLYQSRIEPVLSHRASA
jgi:hypothetical protein